MPDPHDVAKDFLTAHTEGKPRRFKDWDAAVYQLGELLRASTLTSERIRDLAGLAGTSPEALVDEIRKQGPEKVAVHYVELLGRIRHLEATIDSHFFLLAGKRGTPEEVQAYLQSLDPSKLTGLVIGLLDSLQQTRRELFDLRGEDESNSITGTVSESEPIDVPEDTPTADNLTGR